MNLRRLFLTLTLAIFCLGQSAYAQMPHPALVGYWQNWSADLKLTDIPDEYNVIQLAFATTTGSSMYQMEFNLPYNYSKAQFKSDIDVLHGEGKKVILSIGGANDPVRLDNATAKNGFINTINAILADYEYKIDGIDIDFEGTSMQMGSGWTMTNLTTAQQNLVDAIRSIKSTYEAQSGKTMLLTMAPETVYLVGALSSYQLNNSNGGIFLPIIQELKDEIDLLHPQFYNAYESIAIDGQIYRDNGDPDYVTAIAESILRGFTISGKGTFDGFPEEKIAIGIPANHCDSGTGSGFLDPDEIIDATNYLMGKISKPSGWSYTLLGSYPNLGGLMTWSINEDKANCNGSYQFANTYSQIYPEQIKQDQTISFSNIATKTYGDADFTPTVSASSGLAVTLTSSNTNVATIVNGKIHIVGAGSATITASQAGNTNYNPATDVSKTLTVNKKALTITADDLSKKYFQNLPTLTMNYSGFVNGEDQTAITLPSISTTGTKTSDVGDYAISLSGGSASNYSLNLQNGTLSIEKRNLRITADDKSKYQGEANPALTMTFENFVNGDDENDINIPSISTTATTNSAIGTYPISLSSGSATNYNLVFTNGTLTVSQAPKQDQTITFSNIADKTYGDADFTPNVSASSGLDVTLVSSNENVATIVNGKIKIIGAGQVTITASQAGDDSYNPASDVSKSFSVEKAELTISADNKSKVQGEANPALTMSFAGFVNGDNDNAINLPSISTTADESSKVGSYSISLSGGSASNYNLTLNNGTLTVTAIPKQDQSISFSDIATKTYGDDDFTPNVSASSGLDVTLISSNENVAKIVNGNIQIVGAGQVTITASQAGDDSYNPASDVSKNFTVEKTELTVTANNQSRIYGANNPSLTYSISGFKNGDDESDITSPDIATFATNASDAGTYSISLSGGFAQNYSFNLVEGTLTINKAELTISADNKSKVQGEANPPLTMSFAGFVNGEDENDINLPSISTTADKSSKVGSYAISLSGGSASNYNLTLNNGTLSVTAVPMQDQNISFANITNKTYGDAEFTPSVSASSGLDVTLVSSNENVAKIVNGNIQIVGAGQVTITASQAGDDSYNPASNVSKSFTVEKAELKISANDVSINQGEAIPDLRATYDGFVNGDDESVLNNISISTTATDQSQAGDYPITVDSPIQDNYTVQTVEGTLTINLVASILGNATEKLGFYPNPATDIIFLEGYEEFESVEIISMDGRTVLSTNSPSAQLNIQDLAKGAYLIQAKSGDQTITNRLIKR